MPTAVNKRRQEGPTLTQDVFGDQSQVIIGNLRADLDYSVMIRANTQVGPGPYSIPYNTGIHAYSLYVHDSH